MTETKVERWERKIEFVALHLADDDGHVWSRLPERSAWRANKQRYRAKARKACGAANLWDMMSDYRKAKADA